MKNILLLLLIAGLALSSHSQSHVIYGNVYAFNDLSLTNIHVKAKKSKTEVSTDSLGNFSIVCFDKDQLTFSGGGFADIKRRVNKSDKQLKVKMRFKGGAENAEIAVGYGCISREMLSYAVSHYSMYNNDFSNYTDIYELIKEKFPTVQVVTANGGKQFVVRGTGTITGNNFALIVVDGIITTDISYITPCQLNTIDIIKDSGAAIYGSRGANGVVMITTIK
jgi:TonB-dependent SusC/RagA subfamily outer membrane receptor